MTHSGTISFMTSCTSPASNSSLPPQTCLSCLCPRFTRSWSGRPECPLPRRRSRFSVSVGVIDSSTRIHGDSCVPTEPTRGIPADDQCRPCHPAARVQKRSCSSLTDGAGERAQIRLDQLHAPPDSISRRALHARSRFAPSTLPRPSCPPHFPR